MKKVIKRDGKKEKFKKEKITAAIQKALDATAVKADPAKLTVAVQSCLRGTEIKVEDLQDIVEQVLMAKNLYKTAKAYILYRRKRQDVRMLAASLGIEDPGTAGVNALHVLASRYLRRDGERNFVETPTQLYKRVADFLNVSSELEELMATGQFMPNSPTLMNAGTDLGQLSACFVLPVPDSIDGIFETIKQTAMTHKTGGGTGFSFSNIRPEGDIVKSTGGVASGPLSFITVFNAATEVIKQGGKRRGANLGVLNVHHPDILDFVTAKTREGYLSNFNLSVGVDDQFMECVEQDTSYNLINPRTKRVVRSIKARAVFDLMVAEAWKTGDPGLIFLDTVNNSTSNAIPKFGPIESTNPCGEVPLYPYEVCNLGAINLSKCVHEKHVDFNKLEKLVTVGVQVLDRVIDLNKLPVPEMDKMSKLTRRIGLGVMGFADMLIQLGLSYGESKSLDVAKEVMKFINDKAHQESQRLGAEKGDFPAFQDSIWPSKGYKHLRNCCCTTVAPTGTISIIAGGCSSGIEPLISVAIVRQVESTIGTNLFEVSTQFEQLMVQEGLYSPELIEKVSRHQSIQQVSEIPEDLRRLFVTAHDISPENHILMQSTFQHYVDNAISKTINLPKEATPRDIEKAFMMTWKYDCKGVTVYRDQCKTKQLFECPRCAEVT